MIFKRTEEITTFELYLDNTITTREWKEHCLKDYRLKYVETILFLEGAVTINLYKSDEASYYLIFNYKTDSYSLFKERN